MDVFEEIVRLRALGQKCALATIVEVRGSIPSFETAKLLVREDGSMVGTIGGGCVACARTASLDTYKRAGAMLGKALLPPKKRPDAVDALVVVTAALHGPAQILTSDPEDVRAYTATLDHADIITETI